MRVVVLGAGITGVATAWYLAAEGHDVTVIERQPAAGLETSFANGGQLSVSQSEPWANPQAPLKVLKWLWKEDAPLLFRPKLDPAQWRWCLQFLVECLPGRTAQNSRQMVQLGLYSRQALQELRQAIDIQYDSLQRGILQLYFSQQDLDAAAEAAELMTGLGCERRVIDTAGAVKLEPALATCREQLAGATWCESDESGDAHRFTQALAAHAAERGVEFRYETMVKQIVADSQRVHSLHLQLADGSEKLEKIDAVVVCMGSYSPLLLAPLGIRLNIYPAKGYSATISTLGYQGAPTVSLTDDRYKMVFTRLGDRLRIAGTAELSGYNLDLNTVRCEALLKRTLQLFPEAGDPASVEYWTGLRPATPSNVPYIGRTHLQNLYLNTGHGTLGWTEACGSAKALAALVGGRKPELDFEFYQGR